MKARCSASGPASGATVPATASPATRSALDMRGLAPQWSHPLVNGGDRDNRPLSKDELRALAYDFYLRFLTFFRHRPEGSIETGVEIEFTLRMRQKLGLAYLFEHKIRLNQAYFAKDPSLLPYTLFHEMTHLWLYDCFLDPGHTHRFYNKMAEFQSTGLLVDPDVHIHTRVAPEGKFVYSCPNCKNRWYLRDRLRYSIYCGHCFDKNGVEYYAKRLKTHPRPALSESGSDNAA
jgi:predicted SprT family Zn-dependent metalloprotease